MEKREKQKGHRKAAPPATRSIADWVDQLTFNQHRRPGTVRVYMGDLNDFARFLGKDMTDSRLLHATRNDISRYIRTLGAVRQAKAISVRRVLAALRSFYGYLVFKRKIRDNPTAGIELPKLPGPYPKHLKEHEVWTILSARVHTDDEELYLRDRAIFETLYATGIRVAELCNADLDHLNKEMKWLFIPEPKGMRPRYAFINQSALQAINNYLAIRPDTPSTRALFVTKRGQRLTTRTVHRAFTSRLLASGFLKADREKLSKPKKYSQGITPHALRHSFARHLLEHGAEVAEVQNLLGHRHINTTQVYITPEMTKLRSTYAAAHPRDRFEYAENERLRSKNPEQESSKKLQLRKSGGRAH